MDLITSYQIIDPSLNNHVKRFSFKEGKHPLVLHDKHTDNPVLFLWFSAVSLKDIKRIYRFKTKTDFNVKVPLGIDLEIVYLNVSDHPILVSWSDRILYESFNRYKLVNAWHPQRCYSPCYIDFKDDYNSSVFSTKDLPESWLMTLYNIEGYWSFEEKDILITNDLTLTQRRGKTSKDDIDFDPRYKFPFEFQPEVNETRFKDIDDISFAEFHWKPFQKSIISRFP